LGALLAGTTLLVALSALYQILATSSDANTYPPPGELVSVGGHRLHIHCAGHGNIPQGQQTSTRALGLPSKAYRARTDETNSCDARQLNSCDARQLELQRAAVPNAPVPVLNSSPVRDLTPGFSRAGIKKVWGESQDDLTNWRTNTARILVNRSGHDIDLDQPKLGIGAIINVIAQVRNLEH
jgi:hypothetical protein